MSRIRPGTTALWLGALGAIVGASSCDTPGCGPTPDEVLRENVEKVVFASETLITYRDGKTPIGVFFDEQHRRAVRWDDLPVPWMVAIVAAEDGRYWSHAGVDAASIARATRDNAQAGTVVSGGSTLTQQTAKNLFDRPGRTIDAKLEELDYALHLEKNYTKREILTFYANLFHVTGNGAGLSIAARYFFDEDPSELTVLESAFIAGLVKGPANYDPFVTGAEQQATNIERAHDRTRYVLQRMIDEPIEHLVPKPGDGKQVTEADIEKVRAEAKRLLAEGFTLPFRRGQFRFDTSAVLDEVNRRLASPAIQQALTEAGVDDYATAGLTVVTTLDPVAQHEATYGLWHQLTDLGVMLEGLDATVFVTPNGTPPRADPSRPPRRHEFRNAVVTEHVDDEGGKFVRVDLGGFPCDVDRAAIVRAAGAIAKGKAKDRYAKVPTAEVDAFVDGLADTSVVSVSIRETPAGGTPLCDLEARPELQGALVVVQQGQMRAMVGGSTNKDFNRATAVRQMGSTFKPLVYHAAMTLGWLPDDVLDNRRNVFPFSGTFYWPSPDHEPHDAVSMAWAGVASENLASIWLMYHLTDRLTEGEFAEVARSVGLARAADETPEAYQARIQKVGVLPTAGRLVEGQFLAARTEVAASLRAEGKEEEARELSTIGYGWGWSKESPDSASQRWALDGSWVHLDGLRQKCATQFAELERALGKGDAPRNVPDLSVSVGESPPRVACGTRPAGFVAAASGARGVVLAETAPAEPPPEVAPEGEPEEGPDAPAEGNEGRRGKARKAKAKAQQPDPRPEPAAEEPAPKGRGDLPVDDMIVDGRVTYGTLASVAAAMERRKLLAETEKHGLYDPEVLYWHQDFRTLVNLRYIKQIAAKYGVKTELAEVLSLPLGATEITLEEATRMYEGLVTGQSWADGGEVPVDDRPTMLIAEIRSAEGEVLYKAEPTATQVATPAIGQMTADILRNVVLYGTARSAKGAVKAGGATVPIGGKTGTTNDFKNAAFFGYLPGASPAGYDPANGWIVGAYVGYDDNRPMKVGKISVAGAVGALPAWLPTVIGIQATHGDPSPGGTAEDGAWPLAHADDLHTRLVAVDDGGIPVEAGAEGDLATVLTRDHRASNEPVSEAPAKGPRGPKRGRKKAWWQFW